MEGRSPFEKASLEDLKKAIDAWEEGLKRKTEELSLASRTCPMCGELSKPNGHAFKCGRCGFQADRHLVAAWNVAVKLPMWGALSLPPKALNEPLVIEVRGKG